MTQKEKLFIEVNELSNQYKTIIDENGLSTSNYAYGRCFDRYPYKYKVTELHELIENYKNLISNAKYSFDLDELGRILFSPNQDIASLQPVWTYVDGNSSILYPDIHQISFLNVC